MKRFLLIIMACFILFCTGCEKDKSNNQVQNTEREENITKTEHEQKLTSEKWIDAGYRNRRQL